ncbi:thermosome subunit [Candidatus Woesearchaeota archaeon CG11_big_fil_rev_8_21_14_0_20_43_8]|nr:MAG: thermosome subunit [Candidatus Woesearchaeota archaeon CG11_big_fil_rev_8_21_14_0_20_43_8]PIO05112.1 MAG: thermosome subunit [Candidatus Woesearchaeota archaeon CG08_land_8_20_14_0_20_43_7]
MSNQMQPIFILPEGTQRTQGRNAQRTNIMAAKLVAETVRTTLGPKGMDKMIVDSLGDVTVTNDGVTILEEMQIEHPSAKMIVEVAKTQENEVGDGTTTAVVVAGELLKNAERLLEQNIHSTVIAKGYRMAADRSQEILRSIGEKVTEKDDKLLKQVAMTAMTGKGAESSKELLATLVIKAVKRIVEKEEKGLYIDINNVKVEAKVGSGVEDSEMIEGVVLDKEKVHAAMPRVVKGAKVAIIDSAMEVKGTEADTKISVSDPQQFQAFIDQEEKMLRDMVDKVTSTGATVVFCQKGIDDMAQHFLAKRGVFAVRRVKKSDVENLSRATGANIITNLHDLTSKDLGFAGTVEEVKVGDENMVFVRECKNPKAVTLLLRGGTSHVVDEIKRAVTDAIGDVASALKSGSIVAGAGAPEMEVARQLKKFADTLSGREQLAVLAFAEAIEVIPRTLAENAGLDPIDVLTELRAAHDQKNKWAGINVFTGKVMDAWKAGVLEPLKIKTQAIKSASEVAVMILRIDDVIAGSSHGGGGPDMMPPGGMGGMPGMM